MHDFRRHGSPVECSMDAFAAEIEPPPRSAGYTLPVDPAVETRPRPITNADGPLPAVHQAVLQRIIMHVIEMVRDIFVVFDRLLPESRCRAFAAPTDRRRADGPPQAVGDGQSPA